jgi:hypothetical protein
MLSVANREKAVMNASWRKAGFSHDILKGFIFLGTPHKGSYFIAFGMIKSTFGYWKGSNTSLLEAVKPGSQVNRHLHDQFTYLIAEKGLVSKNTVCVFETVKEAIFGFPILEVSAYSLSNRIMRLITFQVVERDSAVIDGSRTIPSEKGHRDIQRYASRDEHEYQVILFRIREWVEEEKQRKLGMH